MIYALYIKLNALQKWEKQHGRGSMKDEIFFKMNELKSIMQAINLTS